MKAPQRVYLEGEDSPVCSNGFWEEQDPSEQPPTPPQPPHPHPRSIWNTSAFHISSPGFWSV